MNILVIGNGFDIAHDLPTTYRSYLDFIKDIEKVNVGKEVKESVSPLADNIWIKYLTNKNNDNGWVDFENEISKVIQLITAKRYGKMIIDPELVSIANNILDYFSENLKIDLRKVKMYTDENYKKQVITPLIESLDEIVEGLEIYLVKVVAKEKIKKKSSDFEGITHVLSFNYTDTFKKVYDNRPIRIGGPPPIQYHYIHGNVREDKNIRENNMVLGISETDLVKEDDLDFLEFKKYFQRISKFTGINYKNWLVDLEKDIRMKPGKHGIYIYGHSLDLTDREILYELLTLDEVTCYIYYHDKEAYKKYITNIIKILGKELFLEKYCMVEPRIKFVKQATLL